MNSDEKLYFTTNFRDEKANADVMRNALSLIAKEIQRFRSNYETGEGDDHDEIFKTVDGYAKKINVKNRELKKLKDGLKIACNVARIVLSAKNRETHLQATDMNAVRNESSGISKISAQYLILTNFLHFGYEKLQIMRNETPKQIPFIFKLKTILLACGQYYADYCNERERCSRLERQNRFLKNKITILETNLAATTEELRNLRNQNVRLRVKCNVNEINAIGAKKVTSSNVGEMCLVKHLKGDQCDIASYNAAIQKSSNTVEYSRLSRETSKKTLYLTTHLDNISKRLSDQVNIMQELKDLYDEF